MKSFRLGEIFATKPWAALILDLQDPGKRLRSNRTLPASRSQLTFRFFNMVFVVVHLVPESTR